MSEPHNILVVDDDPRVRTMLRRYLVEEGFHVAEAADGSAMRAALDGHQTDLVLLDLMMPGEDGLSLARQVRQRSDIPIIMLTGKGDLIDRVAGLEAGADDYIAKPFHLREVLARIRTVLRRGRAPARTNQSASPDEREVLVFQGWRLDLARRELKRQAGDEAVPLTTGEFELLRAFAAHPNRVLTRDQLMSLVKGQDWAAYDRAIDAQVARLRKKIESNPGNPLLIKTVRGAGYIFAATVTSG